MIRKNNYSDSVEFGLEAGDGLQARSMTRDYDWGIPVPVDCAEGKSSITHVCDAALSLLLQKNGQ